MRRKLVVGNWKMHGSHAANAQLVGGLQAAGPWVAEVAVCPPFPYLAEVALSLQGGAIAWGAQDCSAHESGAHTGEVSAAMLAEFGCRYVIVGHSERRGAHAESDQLVADKAKAALAHRLTPIVCVGETLEERDAGRTEQVVGRQLDAVLSQVNFGQAVLAYEPVWAIGTGVAATIQDAAEAIGFIRGELASLQGQGVADAVCILYGGSVSPANIADFLAQPDIDGGLVGGAALQAESFTAMVRAAAG
jgi:triosephosphate isomerase